MRLRLSTRTSGTILSFALTLAFCRLAHGVIGSITTMAGTGTPGLSGDAGPATAADLNEPRQLALDVAGNLFAAEVGNHRIRRVDTSGIITTVAGTTAGFSGDGGLAVAAQLHRPVDVAVDAAGNVFVADLDNHRIRRIDANTGIITTVAGSTPGFSGDGGLATTAELFAPYAVAVDAVGNLFVADLGNQRVRRVDAVSGIITTVAGTGVAGFAGDGGLATAAELNGPIDVVPDAAGNVFIADFNNHRVRRVDAVRGLIATVVGTGTPGFAGDGGPAAAARCDGPVGIGFDAGENLFVADLNNRRVRRVDYVSGIILTVAGSGEGSASGDGGPATSAGIEGPFGVALDPSGTLFIADRLAHQVRRAEAVSIPCPTGTTASYGARLTAGNLHTLSADDRLSLKAKSTLPYPFLPALDPATNGVRLVVTDFLDAAILLDATIPGGSGWQANGSATSWRFTSSGTAEGITGVWVRPVPSQPGLVKLRMKGRDGNYGSLRVPVTAALLLDPPTASTGQCVVARWQASPPASPSCVLTPAGRELRCH